MNIEWMVLAEGVAQDARGAFTIVGLSQNVLFSEALPTQTKRAVMVHLVGDAAEAQRDLRQTTFTFSVFAPSGSVVLASSGQLSVENPRFPDLPVTLDIPADFMIPITEFGEYRVEFDIRYSSGESAKSSVSLYSRSVEPGEVAGAATSGAGASNG